MQVRAAAAADAERLAALATQLGYPSTKEDVERRLPALASEGHRVLVAVENDCVVGWVHLAHVVLLDSDPWIEVKALIVDELSRSRGIGESLMSAAEDWARARRCDTVRLRSNVVRERAHRFYERLGYAVVKTQRVFSKRIAG